MIATQQARNNGRSKRQILKDEHRMYKFENNTNFSLVDCWRLLEDEPKCNTMYQPERSKEQRFCSWELILQSEMQTLVIMSTWGEAYWSKSGKAIKREVKNKSQGKNESEFTILETNERKASALVKLVTEKRGRHKEKEAEHDRMTNYMDYLVMDTSYTTPEQKKKDHENLCTYIKINFLKT